MNNSRKFLRTYDSFRLTHLLMILIFVLVGHQSFSGEEDAEHASEPKIELEKWFSLKNRPGRFVLLYHKDGHINGHEHVVELRPDCLLKSKVYTELETRNSMAQCHIFPESIVYDPKSESITFKGLVVDYDKAQANLLRDQPNSEAPCKREFDSNGRLKLLDFKLSTVNLCRRIGKT